MMPQKESILKNKAEAYSFRIIRLYQHLTEVRKEKILSKQILRSGTSIGANVAESRNAQSAPDFISKLSIALKEAGETEFWLKSLFHGKYINEKEFNSMINDNTEIIRILTKSIKTMKQKHVKP